MENNLIRYLEEQDRRSDVSYDVERHEDERIPGPIIIINDDENDVLPIYISSDEEEVQDVDVVEISDEDPEEGKYVGKYGNSLRAEGIKEQADEEEHGQEEYHEEDVAEREDDGEREETWDGDDEREDETDQEEEEQDEEEIAEEREEEVDGDEDREEENNREEAGEADEAREEEEDIQEVINREWVQQVFEESSSEWTGSDSEWTSTDSGYCTMTYDEESEEDGAVGAEGVAAEDVEGEEVDSSEEGQVPASPSRVLSMPDLWSFHRAVPDEEAPSTSGVGTSRDRNREENLWSFYVNFLGEIPPMSGLGTSREEGQGRSQSCFGNNDLLSCFGITPDDEAPSTSGLSTSRKRSREEEEEEEEEEEQRPAQRPRRSSEEGLRDEPTPSTSGLNSWTQGVRPWEGIYPSRDSDSDYD